MREFIWRIAENVLQYWQDMVTCSDGIDRAVVYYMTAEEISELQGYDVVGEGVQKMSGPEIRKMRAWHNKQAFDSP